MHNSFRAARALDASYGACYMARAGHNAFAETLLRDLTLDVVHEAELATHCLTLLCPVDRSCPW